MNVTSKGYYTTQYLDNVTRKRYRGTEVDSDNGYFNQPQSRPSSPGIREHIAGDKSPRSMRSLTPVGDENLLRSPVSPGFTKSPSRNGSPLGSPVLENLPTVSRTLGSSIGSEDYDPDYLEQEITPAQLHRLQNRNTALYQPHRVRRDQVIIHGQQGKQGKQVKQPTSEDEYYIKQKQRYDQSLYKPKFYTHKTFRDVFEDEKNNTDKYNPMEFVFDDPGSRNEQEQNQKLKKALRILQTKMGKDNYKQYDYYQKMSGPQRAQKPVPTSRNADVRDNDENNFNDNIYITEEENKQLKKNKNFKNVFKRKMKKAKNDLASDYNNSIKGPELIMETDSTSQPIVLEPEEEQTPITTQPTQPNQPDQETNFLPLWSYILSWLVYDQTNIPAIQEEPVIDTKTKSKTRPLRNRIDMKNFRRNYQGVVSNWNQPVSTVFKNGKPIDSMPLVRNNRGMIDSELLNNASQEFVIEVDDDYDDYDEEFYYNPTSKQLEQQPEASYLSYFPTSMLDRTTNRGLIDTSNGPVAIISNINTLIKNIKVMRIIFAPIDIIALHFPNLQTVVILVELVIFLWILYELSLLIDALCMMVKAVCAPMIAMGRFMNRIV